MSDNTTKTLIDLVDILTYECNEMTSSGGMMCIDNGSALEHMILKNKDVAFFPMDVSEFRRDADFIIGIGTRNSAKHFNTNVKIKAGNHVVMDIKVMRGAREMFKYPICLIASGITDVVIETEDPTGVFLIVGCLNTDYRRVMAIGKYSWGPCFYAGDGTIQPVPETHDVVELPLLNINRPSFGGCCLKSEEDHKEFREMIGYCA